MRERDGEARLQASLPDDMEQAERGCPCVYRPVFTRISDMVLPEEAATHSRGTAGKVHDRICRTEQAAQPETGFLLPHDRCLVSLLWENGCVFTGTRARLATIRKPDGLFQLILPLNPKEE